MSIDFRCPTGHKLSMPDTLAGRKARCPLCRRKMLVPDDNSRPNQMAEEVSESDASQDSTQDDSTQELESKPSGGNPWASLRDTETYQPDQGKVQTVHLLAVGLVMAALFAAAPALRHWNLAAAPDWARLVLLIAALQLLYIGWMVSIPDWSTVWVGMLVFALVATVYGAGLAIFMYTPVAAPLILELDESARRSAAGWCAAVVLLTGMMTFVSGRVSAGWRRSIELARRRK